MDPAVHANNNRARDGQEVDHQDGDADGGVGVDGGERLFTVQESNPASFAQRALSNGRIHRDRFERAGRHVAALAGECVRVGVQDYPSAGVRHRQVIPVEVSEAQQDDVPSCEELMRRLRRLSDQVLVGQRTLPIPEVWRRSPYDALTFDRGSDPIAPPETRLSDDETAVTAGSSSLVVLDRNRTGAGLPACISWAAPANTESTAWVAPTDTESLGQDAAVSVISPVPRIAPSGRIEVPPVRLPDVTLTRLNTGADVAASLAPEPRSQSDYHPALPPANSSTLLPATPPEAPWVARDIPLDVIFRDVSGLCRSKSLPDNHQAVMSADKNVEKGMDNLQGSGGRGMFVPDLEAKPDHQATALGFCRGTTVRRSV